MHCRARLTVVAGLLLMTTESLVAKSRFNVTLDDGTSVTVDNASSLYSDGWVTGLVLAADRSTQEDCPYNAPSYKGLFKTGDRIFVSNNYLAWFDYTQNDGKAFNVPPYGGNWERSGALAGWWSLDPSTSYFRYWKTGPNGCWNWAHNELIPGSASPNQEQHWWDKYAPPTEHSFQVAVGSSRYFLSYHYAKQTANSQWANVLDGTEDAAGVHYKTSARMTSWTFNVDVSDGNDANGIGNYVQADVEYLCRSDDMVVTWNFRPNSANVVLDNLFVFLWYAFAQDEDGTACDAGGSGSQWPGTVYGQSRYVQSYHTMYGNFSPFGPYSAGSIQFLQLGPLCSNPYVNYQFYTSPAFAVGNGSWIRCGESSSLSINSPRWQYINLGVPNTGSGTPASPYQIAWDTLDVWHETHDGTLGLGVQRGPYSNPSQYITLQSGSWYRASFAIRTNF